MSTNTKERILDSQRDAVSPSGLHRHRRQTDRRRRRRAVLLALPLLPQRQGPARRRGHPFLRPDVRGARRRPCSTRRPTSSRACTTASQAPPRRCARPTTPTPARSPRSRSRSRAPTSRCDIATAEVFERWITSSTERFVAAGIPEATARELAIGMIGALEGAFVLSRAMRSTEPLDVAGTHAAVVVEAALRSAVTEYRMGHVRLLKE